MKLHLKKFLNLKNYYLELKHEKLVLMINNIKIFYKFPFLLINNY